MAEHEGTMGEAPCARSFVVNRALVSEDALLRACYWYSRDFSYEVVANGPDAWTVMLKSKTPSKASLDIASEEFLATAMDFELRCRVAAQTSGIRDVLLAKAFAESGVLEDKPEGIFGDTIEEARPDGMFKILSND